jgi:hypothetical protein
MVGIEFSHEYSLVIGNGEGEWRFLITATYYAVTQK